MRWLWLLVWVLAAAAVTAWLTGSPGRPAPRGGPIEIASTDDLTDPVAPGTPTAAVAVPGPTTAPPEPKDARPVPRLRAVSAPGRAGVAASGVELVRPDGPLAVPSGRAEITAGPPSDAQAGAAAALVADELDLYPAAFVRRLRLARVVLAGGLTRDEVPVGGLADPEARTIYLDVVPLLRDRGYARVAVHHELFHLADRRAGRDAEWAALNPPGFRYTDELPGTARPDRPPARAAGFVSDYARTSGEEDRAEVFGHLMADPSAVGRLAAGDPVLAGKVARVKARVARFCPALDGAFWERVARARAGQGGTPTEPPAAPARSERNR